MIGPSGEGDDGGFRNVVHMANELDYRSIYLLISLEGHDDDKFRARILGQFKPYCLACTGSAAQVNEIADLIRVHTLEIICVTFIGQVTCLCAKTYVMYVIDKYHISHQSPARKHAFCHYK